MKAILAFALGLLVTGCVANRGGDRADVSGTKDDDGPNAADLAQAKTGDQLDAENTAAPAAKPAPAVATADAKPLKRSAKLEKTKVPAKVAAKAPASNEKLIRFVSAEILNVRSAPRSDAPIVGKLARGSMFTVTIQGEWARLADGEFVLAKFLSRSEPSVRERIARSH